MTFSLNPRRKSTFPSVAASVKTRVVSWNDAALKKDSVSSEAFVAFVQIRQMEAWMVILIVARELAITGLRLLAASKSVVLAAEGFGKHKTISQIVSIVATLVVLSYGTWGRFGEWVFGFGVAGKPWVVGFAELSKWIAVFLTAFSGIVYLWKNRALYLEDV